MGASTKLEILIYSSKISFFFGLLNLGPPVTKIEFFNLFFFETLILELLKKAPEPFSAKKVSFLIGSNIKPQTISPFSS